MEGKRISRAYSGILNRMLITPEFPLPSFNTSLQIAYSMPGFVPWDTSLSSLVTCTSLLNVFISPCLLGVPRDLNWSKSGLSEFCG